MWTNQEDIKVAPVLPTAAISCSLKEQGPVLQNAPCEIYTGEKWPQIQQKDYDLMKVQCFLSLRCKLSFRVCQKLSNTARAILRQWDRIETQENVLYYQSRIPTEQLGILQILVPQSHIICVYYVLHTATRLADHFRVLSQEVLHLSMAARLSPEDLLVMQGLLCT